jgi:hypothetical protein
MNSSFIQPFYIFFSLSFSRFMFYWNLKNHDREVNPRKRREKGGKRIYKERIVKNHQLNPAWKTITVYVVISCKGCKFWGRGGMTGAAGKPGKPGVRWTQCVCTEQIETTMQTLTFFGGVALSRNGHKNDQTWQWLCKGGGGALFLSYIACVFHFWPFFFLFLTARPIGVQPPPQLLHFRYPNHQRQIDTGVCVWHRYGQLVSTADCYYYLCIPLNVTKGEEGRAKRKGRPTKREDKWLERTIRRAFRPSCQGSL